MIKKVSDVTPTLNVSTVQNTKTSSNVDTYSCNYLNGTVLYEDASGTQNNVTLSDSINNYSYIEIYSRWYTGLSVPAVKLAVGHIQNNRFIISFNSTDGNHPIIYAKLYSISGTSITKVDFHYYVIDTTEYATWDVLYITKVVGYK